MVKKISGQKRVGGDGQGRTELQSKRLKLKKLHRHSAEDRAAFQGVPAEQLPPASASNAARQARSRANNTFPVDWQELHLKKTTDETTPDTEEE